MLNRLQHSGNITFISSRKPKHLYDLLQYLLYCSGLESSQKHLGGSPVLYSGKMLNFLILNILLYWGDRKSCSWEIHIRVFREKGGRCLQLIYVWYLHENTQREKAQGEMSVMVNLGEGYTGIPYILAPCLLNLYQNKKLQKIITKK